VGNNSVPGVPATDYNTTAGYDLASGLGSVNITNLVNQWSTATFNPSVTTLTVTPTSFTHGSSATFNITVAPKSGSPSFNNELAALLSSTGAAVSDVLLSSTGTASGMTNDVPGGSTTLKAHYPGNGVLGASDSTAVAVTVAPEPSVTTLAAVNGSGNTYTGGVFGSAVILNATVSGKSGFGIPTDGVVFNNNGVALTVPISLDSNGKASVTTGPFSQVGTYSLTANYLGDASFLPSSTPSAIKFTITKATPTATVQSNLSTVAPGTDVSLTATIPTSSQAGFPTGSVTFFSGTTALNTVMVGGSNQGGFDYGTALLVTSGLPTGMNSITVQYTGDSNFNGATSPAIVVNVTAQPDFAVSATPSTVTVSSPGQSATTTLAVAGSNGFSAATTFSCAGLPAKSACVFMPATVTGSGSTMLTVTTTAASFALPVSPQQNPWNIAGSALRAVTFSMALLILALQLRRRRWNFVRSTLAVAMLATLAACGGGGGSTPPPVIPGTPTGTQTVTVTATSGALTHTTTFTLTVN
jgi:trimeric autotransporter adhesin